MNADNLSAPACEVPSDVPERLARIEEHIGEIKTALVGNPKLGHRGLVSRVEHIEGKVENHDRKLVVWGSIVTAGLVAASFFKDAILGRK